MTQIDPWMVPKVLKLSSNVSDAFLQVLKLSSESSECKPLAVGVAQAEVRWIEAGAYTRSLQSST